MCLNLLEAKAKSYKGASSSAQNWRGSNFYNGKSAVYNVGKLNIKGYCSCIITNHFILKLYVLFTI